MTNQKNKEMEETLSLTEIVKGNTAKFSHYCAGNLYYNVEVNGETYQFPMKAVDVSEIQPDEFNMMKEFIESEDLFGRLFEEFKQKKAEEKKCCTNDSCECRVQSKPLFSLSEDLGTTNFETEYGAMTLMRWIRMAMKNDEFVKIS